jgi:predicted amidophosphoribosyltransferase
MSNGCPNCEALCAICQDNTYNWHEPLCSSCRLAVAHTEERIIKLLEDDPEDLISAGGGLRAGYETAIELIKGEK